MAWQLRKLVALAPILALAATTALPAPADPGCCDTACGGAGCCESGRLACVATPEPATEERHCWCVTREHVCVPKVRCPWEPGGSPLTCFNWLKDGDNGAGCGDCCEAGGCGCPAHCGCDRCCTPQCGKMKGGKVKCVRDLEKKKYEVDACEWKWEIRRLPPCGCTTGGACCDAVASPCEGF